MELYAISSPVFVMVTRYVSISPDVAGSGVSVALSVRKGYPRTVVVVLLVTFVVTLSALANTIE